MPHPHASTKGFSLIELLIVISVIGILAALLLANFAGIRDRADDAKLKNNLKQVQTALRMYYNDNQAYPSPTPNASTITNYMKITPNEFPALIYYSGGGDTFTACVQLANTADKEAADSQTRCGVSPPLVLGKYCVCSQ